MINTVSHCELLSHWHAELVRGKYFLESEELGV